MDLVKQLAICSSKFLLAFLGLNNTSLVVNLNLSELLAALFQVLSAVHSWFAVQHYEPRTAHATTSVLLHTT